MTGPWAEALDAAAALGERGQPVRSELERADALAHFRARPEEGEPFRHASFGRVPAMPEGPMFPALVPLASGPLRRMVEALEALQRQLVFEADCAEHTDALNNCRQYLHAAGRLDRAAEALLAL